MTGSAEVAEIARKLSPAQREFLSSVPAYAVESYPPVKWLRLKGLIEMRPGAHKWTATPLGLQVQRLLNQEPTP